MKTVTVAITLLASFRYTAALTDIVCSNVVASFQTIDGDLFTDEDRSFVEASLVLAHNDAYQERSMEMAHFVSDSILPSILAGALAPPYASNETSAYTALVAVEACWSSMGNSPSDLLPSNDTISRAWETGFCNELAVEFDASDCVITFVEAAQSKPGGANQGDTPQDDNVPSLVVVKLNVDPSVPAVLSEVQEAYIDESLSLSFDEAYQDSRVQMKRAEVVSKDRLSPPQGIQGKQYDHMMYLMILLADISDGCRLCTGDRLRAVKLDLIDREHQRWEHAFCERLARSDTFGNLGEGDCTIDLHPMIPAEANESSDELVPAKGKPEEWYPQGTPDDTVSSLVVARISIDPSALPAQTKEQEGYINDSLVRSYNDVYQDEKDQMKTANVVSQESVAPPSGVQGKQIDHMMYMMIMLAEMSDGCRLCTGDQLRTAKKDPTVGDHQRWENTFCERLARSDMFENLQDGDCTIELHPLTAVDPKEDPQDMDEPTKPSDGKPGLAPAVGTTESSLVSARLRMHTSKNSVLTENQKSYVDKSLVRSFNAVHPRAEMKTATVVSEDRQVPSIRGANDYMMLLMILLVETEGCPLCTGDAVRMTGLEDPHFQVWQSVFCAMLSLKDDLDVGPGDCELELV